MLREFNNQLKNYNFLQKLCEGYYLDAKDENKWKVGQVKEIKKIGHKYTVEIKFDGHSPKYNEQYDLPSYSSLAPFRKHSLPYTGSSFQVKRQEPIKSLESYIKSLNKIQADIDGLKCEFINQFLRGQLFIFVDYIMTRSSKLQLKYQYDEYVRFLLTYLDTFNKILLKVFDFLKEAQKQGNFDQNYIYVHPKMALLYSITEFLFNCNSLVSRKEQRVTFHNHYGKHQPVDQIYATFLQKMKQIQLYEKCQQLVNYRASNGNKSLPWSIKKQAYIVMKALNPQQPFVAPKDNKQIIEILQYLPYFVKKHVISVQEGDRKFLDLIFNLVIKGNFEGKLIGLNEIKKLISNTHYASTYNSKRDVAILQQIKQKNLIGFLLDNHNFNSELFKRSLIIFEYAYRNKMFTKEHFSSVLKLHKDKHELQLMNFYNSLAEFGTFLNENDALEFFNSMIEVLPLEENFIQLVKNYTIVLIDKNPHYKKLYMNKQQQGFGLLYFWDLINSPNKINKDLMPKIIQGFAKLLNNLYYAKQIERFIVSSIKAIKQLKNSQAFLKVIHQSLKLCKGSKMNKAIQIAQRQVNVIEAAMHVLKQQENTLSKTGFQNLFEFLQQVNAISRKGLSLNDILFMWRLQKSKCRSHLLKFLRKHRIKYNQDKSQQKIINKSLQLSQIQFIIKNIFQNDDLMQNYKQIDQQHYQTIDQLIICYLHNKGYIDYNYKHTIRYKRNQYFTQEQKQFLGMKFYLKCIQNCKIQEVGIKATKRLIEIFLRPDPKEFGKNAIQFKVRNWLKVSNAFNSLKQNKLRSFKVQLVEIYGRMKSLNILEPDPLEIRVKIAGTNKSQLLVVPRYTSLWKFRLIINEKFNLNNSNFQIQLVQQRTSTNLQREEDLSVAFINLSKEKGGVSVVVNPSKQMHPHFKAIQKFKQALSANFGQSLYKNLSSKNQEIVQMSLQILYEIPFLQFLLKDLQKLDVKDWSQIIDPLNMKKLQYQLKIIHSIKELKWIILFLQKGGLKHLSQVVINNIGKNCYKTLNSLMSFFIEALKFAKKQPISFGQQFLKEILIYEKDVTQDYVKYLLSCFTLIKQLSGKIKINTLFQMPNINKVLEVILFTKEKTSLASQLFQICKLNDLFHQLNKVLKGFLNFQYLITKMFECRTFFEVLQILIERNQLKIIIQPLENILVDIRKSDISQKSQNQTNQLLYGYLLCLYQLIKCGNKVQELLLESEESFFKYLLKECLFHPDNIALRKFKSKELRQLGFNFLEMLEFETRNQEEINQILIPMMAKGAWRKQFQWNIEPVELVNKKFTGLKNLAATCYINSLLQQLFFIKSFSSQLMAIDSDQIEDKQNIVREIQNIFGFLKYSQNVSYTTSSLCKNFILDGQPIDPKIQTDVDEFFHALMDKLQRNLQKINKKDIINEIFRGQFSNLIIGQECPHTSERIQHFLSIRLEIKNKKTIYQALDEFIKGEILEGQNSYFCQKCNKKVKALKRVCLKDLPPVMIVTLKRFQFDFDTMQKFKLNTYCSFPQQINFLPYTKAGLQEDCYANKQDYEYKLKGVVIHYGISEAGHYTSYVRTDDKTWRYFDDQKNNQFDLKNLQNQCFGGIQQNPFGDDQDKKKNAYLLIYQKIKPQQVLPQVPQSELKDSKVYSLVEEDNIKNKTVNLLFEPNIQTYIFNASEVNPKAFIIYYHTVFLRNAKRKEKSVQFFNKCKQLLQKKHMAQWYLQEITTTFLKEFVIYGDYEARYIVVSLISYCMRSAVDIGFLMQCVSLLNTRNIIPFAKIFSQAYFAHNEYTKYLVSINTSELVLNLVKGKQIKEGNMILRVPLRKTISQFGHAPQLYIQRKYYDPKDLLQAIQGFKTGISLQQVKQLATQIKNRKTQRALASIIARKYKEPDQLKKLMENYLANELFTFEPKLGQQFYFNFLILIIEQLIKIKDKDQEQRVITLGKLYFELMKEALVGFKCQVILLNGFFKMCLTNITFRNVMAAILSDKQNKKVVQSLKQWLKESMNPIQMIKMERWGWWKKPKRSYPGLTARDIQMEMKPNVKQALSLLNAIIQKHLSQQVPEALQIDDQCYSEQKYGPQLYKVTRKMGFLVEIKDDQGNHRIVSEDELIKKYI